MAEKEYIDRDSAIEQFRLIYCKDCNSYNGVRCRACEFDDAMLLMEDIPAADVVEVRHGEWEIVQGVFTPGGDPLKRCPYCKSPDSEHLDGIESRCQWNWCPVCGTKMDGGKHG